MEFHVRLGGEHKLFLEESLGFWIVAVGIVGNGLKMYKYPKPSTLRLQGSGLASGVSGFFAITV